MRWPYPTRLVDVLHAADVLLGAHIITARPTPEQDQ